MLNSRLPCALPSDTKRNLREHVATMTLRNGKKPKQLKIKVKEDKDIVVKVKSQDQNFFPNNPPPYISPFTYLQRL